MGRQLGCKDNGFTRFNSESYSFTQHKTNGRGRATSLIYPGCLSAASSSSSVVPARLDWKPVRFPLHFPPPQSEPAALNPAHGNHLWNSTNSDAWAPPHTFKSESLGKGSGICIWKSFPGAYTHSQGWRILASFITSCGFCLQNLSNPSSRAPFPLLLIWF